MNSKRKGSRIELRVRDELKSSYYVTKAGGSLGVFDIIAIPSLQVLIDAKAPCLAIQVKANRKPSPAEVQQMLDINLPPYFEKQYWVKPDRKGWRITVLKTGEGL